MQHINVANFIVVAYRRKKINVDVDFAHFESLYFMSKSVVVNKTQANI